MAVQTDCSGVFLAHRRGRPDPWAAAVYAWQVITTATPSMCSVSIRSDSATHGSPVAQVWEGPTTASAALPAMQVGWIEAVAELGPECAGQIPNMATFDAMVSARWAFGPRQGQAGRYCATVRCE